MQINVNRTRKVTGQINSWGQAGQGSVESCILSVPDTPCLHSAKSAFMAVIFMAHTDSVVDVYCTIIQEDSAHRLKIHPMLTTPILLRLVFTGVGSAT